MIIKQIGVFSSGKIIGLIYALIGLLIGGLFSLFALISSAIGLAASGGETEAWIGALFGVGAVIIFPIFYGVLGFVGGLLSALLYNLVAGLVGGLEIEVEGSGQAASPLPTAGGPAVASY